MKICRAFTLIELVVVVAVLSILAALLLPALAGAKADTARAICQSNLRQLGTGMRLFEQDHDDMFPPAAYGVGSSGGSVAQLAWDGYIHRYIGGKASDADLLNGLVDVALSPKVERCPADRGPKIIPGTPYDGEDIFGVRSYAMVNCPELYQKPTTTYGVKYTVTTTSLGVGVWWQDPSGMPDFDAESFKNSVVTDPSGSILLAEQATQNSFVGNVWPAVCNGPAGAGVNSELYQINPTSNQQGNQGKTLYRIHGSRFNYLFHDYRVEALKTNETIGSGGLWAPKGMWTVVAGD